MPFQKGISGNPGGRTKKSWIKDKERFKQARLTWICLLKVRDDLVLERKTIITAEGPKEVDVVLSARDYLQCCKLIMERAVGLPRQEIDLGVKGEIGYSFKINTIDPYARRVVEQQQRIESEAEIGDDKDESNEASEPE